MQGGEDPWAFRVGDAERDQIGNVLSEHAAEGRLTMDELEQREGVLFAATTRAQVAAVVADLPPLAGFPLPDWLADGAPPPAPHEDRAAARKREKLRQDENAIGHTFQAARRALNAQLEGAGPEDAERLRARLQEAQDAAASARQAVAAGDRATAQRFIARLRALASA